MTGTADAQGRGDRTFRTQLWTAVTVTTVILGSICALLAWGRAIWIFSLVFCVMLALLLASQFDAPRFRRPVVMALRATVCLVATIGLVATLGWTGLAWVIVLAGTHTSVDRWLVRILGPVRPVAPDADENLATAGTPPRGADQSDSATKTALPDADGITSLDDETLCQAWRRSFVQLATCRLPARRLEIVRLRQVYLDELARRHPAAVRRWLASGARAASNPMPFVDKPSRGVDEDLSWPEAG